MTEVSLCVCVEGESTSVYWLSHKFWGVQVCFSAVLQKQINCKNCVVGGGVVIVGGIVLWPTYSNAIVAGYNFLQFSCFFSIFIFLFYCIGSWQDEYREPSHKLG